MPSRRMLESMPPEVLDLIASFVSGDDIAQLCHAVRYFKYISMDMHDFARRLQIRTSPRPADLWPRMRMRPFLDLIFAPPILRALGTYSRKALRCRLTTQSPCLTWTTFSAKPLVLKLTICIGYLECCNSDPAALKMTTKWLLKLRIHELEFMSFFSISTQMLGMLHFVPALGSMHLKSLEDCSGVAFSECKSLKKLVLVELFHGEESPEELVQQLLDIVKENRIQQLELYLPRRWQGFLRSDLKDIVAAVFLKHGWLEQVKCTDRIMMQVCRMRV
ncbi:hypothetical protein BJ741DRAFT_22895 [Chytriomyces cf. hyalinus JEL632]|nr:hypothetical protein BJ741DRAFT_22895 [Chytriomyces cf. hyalinus JEL632]